LFGTTAEITVPKGRTTTFTFPSTGEGDKHREILLPAADGIILYLLKRIEKLEDQLPKKKK
jgi:hypothetical protein